MGHMTRKEATETAIAGFLPYLLRDAQIAARLLEGVDRRSAHRSLTQIHPLTQLFLSWQGVPELSRMTADRALLAAQEPDDPCAIAAASWYINHHFRNAGESHEARLKLITETTQLLRLAENRMANDDP
jgi:hypothetical protein